MITTLLLMRGRSPRHHSIVKSACRFCRAFRQHDMRPPKTAIITDWNGRVDEKPRLSIATVGNEPLITVSLSQRLKLKNDLPHCQYPAILRMIAICSIETVKSPPSANAYA